MKNPTMYNLIQSICILIIIIFFPLHLVAQPDYTAIINCNIIDGSGSSIKTNQTILIEGKFIDTLGSEIQIPKNASIIDASGKTIIPGLINMHGHLFALSTTQSDAYPKLYLAGGVTTIFSPGELHPNKVIELREKINKGELIGPRIFTAGPYFDTEPSQLLWIDGSTDTNDIKTKFREWKDKIDAVKVYTNISEEHLKLLVVLAEKEGLFVTGHLGRTTTSKAIELGIHGLEHGLFSISELVSNPQDMKLIMEEIANLDMDNKQLIDIVNQIVDHHVYVDPTIVTFQHLITSSEPVCPNLDEYMGNQAIKYLHYLDSQMNNYYKFNNDHLLNALRNQLVFCKMIYDRGGLLVTGTDPVSPKLLPGFAIYREIELFHKAGIPILEALKAATLNAAIALHKEGEIGSIEPGKFADFVFLDGDPLVDLSNIRKISNVMKEGQLYNPDSLRLSVKHSIKP